MTILRVDTRPQWNQERGVFMYPVLHMLGDSVWVSPRRDGLDALPGSGKAIAICTVPATTAVQMYDLLETNKVTWWLEEIWNELAIKMHADATMTASVLDEGVATYAVSAYGNLLVTVSELPGYYRTQLAAYMFRGRARDFRRANWEGALRIMSEELQDQYVWDRENIHQSTAMFWYTGKRASISIRELRGRHEQEEMAQLERDWCAMRDRLRKSMIEIGDAPKGLVFNEQA